jgi:hypothetical protein
MVVFFQGSGYRAGTFLLLVCLCAGSVMYPVSGAGISDTYEGNLGETINLHGVSFVGNQVYLFFTGPNLPENGVTLTDPTQRADQGHFTIVDVDSDQQWSFKWNTARIDNEIVAGTYTVYVANEPVDRSGLSGNNYKSLTVYLKDDASSDFHASTGTSYTVNPEKNSLTPVETLTPEKPSAPIPEPKVTILPGQTSIGTQTLATKTSEPVVLGVIAVVGSGIILRCHRQKRDDR